jgi:hypothetical protein
MMLNLRLALYLAWLAVAACACGPLTPFPPPVPSPAKIWSIVLAQSGGFAGVSLTVRIQSDGTLTATDARGGREITKPLAAADAIQVERLLNAVNLRDAGGAHSNCADCFSYDLQIIGPREPTRWQGDDTGINDSGVAELIRFLVRLRDEALAGAG